MQLVLKKLVLSELHISCSSTLTNTSQDKARAVGLLGEIASKMKYKHCAVDTRASQHLVSYELKYDE
jgi:hypothetical protein